MMPDLQGNGWGAPGRAMVQLGQSIASLGGDLADIADQPNPEADFNDKMIMLKTDNDVNLSEVQSQSSYTGTGDDYLPSRTEYYDTTTQDAISRITPRNQQKAAIFFEQRRGNFVEGAARFGGQRRQDTLQNTINDAVTTEYGKLATVPPEDFEVQFKQTVTGVDAIIQNAPLPDTLKDKLAGQAAERGYQILNGLAEDPDTAPEIVPRILKMIEEPAPVLNEVPVDQSQTPATGATSVPDGAARVPGLPGGPSGPAMAAPQKLGATDLAPPQQGQGSVAAEPLAFETPSLKRTSGRARAGSIGGLVVHETQGSDTIQGNTSWSNKKNTGANYYIDKQGKIFQWAPDNVAMNHAGVGRGVKGDLRPDLVNENTLAIEILTRPGERPNEIQHQAAARLIAAKAAEYGLKPQDIEAHGRLAPGHKEATEGVSVVDYARQSWGGAAPAQAVASSAEHKPTLTAYSPQKAGHAMEGGYAAARPGPNGKAEVMTLADVTAGRSDYITLAGDKSQFGKEYIIPQITYRDAKGERVTLRNVKAVVHDTGSAFKGKGDQRFDIPVDRDLPSKSLGSQPFSKQQIAFIPADQAGQPTPVAQRGMTQYAGLSKLGAGDVTPEGQRAPNTIPANPQEQGAQPVQVADASGRFVPQGQLRPVPPKPQSWRSVDQQLKGLLIQNMGHLKRQMLQAEAKQDQKTKEAFRLYRDRLTIEGIDLMDSGKLDRGWVEANKEFLSPEKYGQFLRHLSGTTARTEPGTYLDLMDRVDDEPEAVIAEAREHYLNRTLTKSDFDGLMSKANKQLNPDTSLPGWAKDLKGMLKEQTAPHGFASLDRLSRAIDVRRGWDAYVEDKIKQGKLDPNDLKKYTIDSITAFRQRKAVETKQTLDVPRAWTQSTAEGMSVEEVDAATQRLLQALNKELAAAGEDPAARKAITSKYAADAALLKQWRRALEDETLANGGKLPTSKPPTQASPTKPDSNSSKSAN